MMTLDGVTKKKPAEQQAAAELVRLAQEQGLSLTGPDGLLNAADQGGARDRARRGDGPSTWAMRNTTRRAWRRAIPATAARAKTVLTESGRGGDRSAHATPTARFEPQIVKKRQRRLTGVDEMVMSLSAKGLTHRRDLRALRRGLRRHGVEGDDHQDHRQGDRGDDRMGSATPGFGADSSNRCESVKCVLTFPSLQKFGRSLVVQA